MWPNCGTNNLTLDYFVPVWFVDPKIHQKPKYQWDPRTKPKERKNAHHQLSPVYIFMYMCVYIHTCMYIYICVCVYLYIYIYMYIYICIYTYVYIHVCVYVCIYI